MGASALSGRIWPEQTARPLWGGVLESNSAVGKPPSIAPGDPVMSLLLPHGVLLSF